MLSLLFVQETLEDPACLGLHEVSVLVSFKSEYPSASNKVLGRMFSKVKVWYKDGNSKNVFLSLRLDEKNIKFGFQHDFLWGGYLSLSVLLVAQVLYF